MKTTPGACIPPSGASGWRGAPPHSSLGTRCLHPARRGTRQLGTSFRGIIAGLCALALAGCASGASLRPALQDFISRHTACAPATYYRPRWSPDGTQIAYLFSANNVQNGGSTDIFVMDANGANGRRILSDPANYMWSLAWRPDGSKLVFDYQSTALHQVALSGGAPDPFIQGNDSFVANPDWSRDGKHFAFASNHTGTWDIYYGDAPAAPAAINMHRWIDFFVRFADGRGDEQAPAFSPDDTQIAFVSARDGGFDLYTRPAGGGPLKQLTATQADEYYPTWSPDGTKIVYSNGYGPQARLSVIDADGTHQATLGDGYSPDWSGDDSRIAFVSERTGRAEI
jgi:TolB protein